MNDLEKQVEEVLHNLNWLIEPHDSSVELIEVKGRRGSNTLCWILH